MRWICLLCSVAIGAVSAAPLQSLEEHWDTYAVGTDDPVYNERWASMPGATRYAIEAFPDGIPSFWSSPNALKIQKQQAYGITHDLAAEIKGADEDAVEVRGTARNPLTLQFRVDFNNLNKPQKDIIVELSMGDVHVDETSGAEKPVIAVGLTYTWFGASHYPRIFDGRDWYDANDGAGTAVLTDKRWNILTLVVTDETLILTGTQNATGTFSLPREYGGGFDRISIRTMGQDGQLHSMDDTDLTGGEVFPAPPSLPVSVTDVSPSEGPIAGGTAVSIRGDGFQDRAVVLFGGGAATDVVVASAQDITCVTPPHAAGTVDVEVQNPDGGIATLTSGFTYEDGGGGPRFIRGDCNADKAVNIADPITILGYLFAKATKPGCLEACNGNNDGDVNIADAIAILSHLFAHTGPLPQPFPDCGEDPTLGTSCDTPNPHC